MARGFLTMGKGRSAAGTSGYLGFAALRQSPISGRQCRGTSCIGPIGGSAAAAEIKRGVRGRRAAAGCPLTVRAH